MPMYGNAGKYDLQVRQSLDEAIEWANDLIRMIDGSKS